MLSNNRSASFVFYHGIYLFFFAAFLRSLNVQNLANVCQDFFKKN